MLKNYITTAWRNITRSKGYSALNILGLATGMAVALLIGLWVYDQYSFDRFLPGYHQIYQARFKYEENGQIQTQNAVCLPLAIALKKDIPGVKYVVQTDWMGEHGLVAGDKKLYLKGAMAGSDFLKLFQYRLLKGSAATVLEDPYSIVITESTAKGLFGNQDPINKRINLDNAHELKVTGLLQDIPANSTLQFSFIVPFAYYMQANDWVRRAATAWDNSSFQIFVGLEPGVGYREVEPQLQGIAKKYVPDAYKTYHSEVFMQSMKDWHLYTDFKAGVASGGLIDYVQLFSVIGLLVLIIACINFMNLSTARSEKRAREIGIRKAVGSRRADLVIQFLIESVVLTSFAFICSLLFVTIALPGFNTLTKIEVGIPFDNGMFWLAMISYVLLTALLAGIRPAFYLSSFKPVKVLKGKILIGKEGALPRKILVVLQFSCSVALIIGTLIVFQQIQHAKDRPKGYDANRLMMTAVSADLNRNYPALKNDLLQSGIVSSVTKASSPITDIWSNNTINDWQGKGPNETLSMATIAVSDADYFKTLGMQIREGKNFTGNLGSDSLSMIINEAAAKRMRFKEPLNQAVDWGQTVQRAKVIGVVSNALMGSPFSPAVPTYFMLNPDKAAAIMYRLSPSVRISDAITTLSSIFNKYNPSYPYLYHFVDESYAAKFDLETLIGKLAGLFAGLAIFISSLGLFGLVAFIAEQRTKEIGIRKVLGASVSQVWFLLSKDFMSLVLISCLIASPISCYFLQHWLLKYEYRINIGPWVFILAALAVMTVTILTISFQAIKAALMNPVKSLRSE
jgi:putative ABC transport system permease protein